MAKEICLRRIFVICVQLALCTMPAGEPLLKFCNTQAAIIAGKQRCMGLHAHCYTGHFVFYLHKRKIITDLAARGTDLSDFWAHPVILMSAADNLPQMAKACMADGFIRKPFQLEELKKKD